MRYGVVRRAETLCRVRAYPAIDRYPRLSAGSAEKVRGCAIHRGLPSPAWGCRRFATAERCRFEAPRGWMMSRSDDSGVDSSGPCPGLQLAAKMGQRCAIFESQRFARPVLPASMIRAASSITKKWPWHALSAETDPFGGRSQTIPTPHLCDRPRSRNPLACAFDFVFAMISSNRGAVQLSGRYTHCRQRQSLGQRGDRCGRLHRVE
jgi:hypothetical protein